MKRNSLLILAVLISVFLAVNSTKKIGTFRTNAQKVQEAKLRLEKVKAEYGALRGELEYKESQEFAEEEIRNKLGLVREGEAVVIVPKEDDENLTTNGQSRNSPNWQKWWDLFFGEI